ncbi:hypothetical protein [Anabaena subtropica]|uniref:Uncharacterized protein n=1 Tax=Anabaena subtropica FACHB-260 TaxID=2692884 RepID=A0ABR8CU67_9NOST|nr:hypothetical protein [Anabaena subtropica]MBD2346040.1 hypothetical protein [Anabaena subtropica FACHB-260]
MLQIVTGITLILVGGAAMFAWIQNRPAENLETMDDRNPLNTVPTNLQ